MSDIIFWNYDRLDEGILTLKSNINQLEVALTEVNSLALVNTTGSINDKVAQVNLDIAENIQMRIDILCKMVEHIEAKALEVKLADKNTFVDTV